MIFEVQNCYFHFLSALFSSCLYVRASLGSSACVRPSTNLAERTAVCDGLIATWDPEGLELRSRMVVQEARRTSTIEIEDVLAVTSSTPLLETVCVAS